MLKKTGIVVATAAAGLLALSPLAFAGDYDGDDDNGGDDSSHHEDSADVNCEQDNSATHENEGEDEDGGLISISDNSVQVPVQACGNDILSGVVGILAKDLENNSSP